MHVKLFVQIGKTVMALQFVHTTVSNLSEDTAIYSLVQHLMEKRQSK